jgi:predicted transcriptional regulator
MFGSAFWKAYANYTYILTKTQEGKHVLTVEKRRNDKVGFDKLELRLVSPVPLHYIYADKDPGSAKLKILVAVTESAEPVSAKMIEELTQLSRASVYRGVKMLMDEGRIKKHVDIHGSHTYEIGE